ncbi:MAG: T9SS type A sorting domain-containing protein [Candidatus Electryonea clarkiae]|nr:T9SS type A sorting domain-containing protein [Candidatus Electryonea clarkiae]MDP8286880.1 T9SS type A sorting domain-containing protein [Candidatus Electryonea clarkiae]
MHGKKRFIILIILLSVFHLTGNPGFSQINFTRHNVSTNFDGVEEIIVIDLDEDGDLDIAGAARMGDDIAWWENDGNQDYLQHSIANDFDGAISVFVADLDSDNDLDIIGAALLDDEIAWWENDGSEDFTEHTITGNYDGANRVFAADIDSDDDMDILGASRVGDNITWWENDGNQNFTANILTAEFDGVSSILATDIDNDEDIDILGSARIDCAIKLWQNDGNQFFREYSIATDFEGAEGIFVTDLDMDEDLDILGAAEDNDEIAWWEQSENHLFTGHTITTSFNSAIAVFACDFDRDSDIDVIGASQSNDEISWWKNDGNQEFTQHSVTTNFNGVQSIHAVDFDDDHDVDVLGAAFASDDIAWFESDLDPLPPDSFDLVSPDSGQLYTETEITLSWQVANDPDSLDVAVYDVYVSADPNNLDDPIDWGLENTTLTFDAPNQLVYWWTIQARDPANMATWANQLWSFRVDWQEPPLGFALLYPEDGSTIQIDETLEIHLAWQESFEPDIMDTMRYVLNFRITMNDGSELILPYTITEDTAYTVNLPEIFDLEYWEQPFEVDWSVVGYSGPDTVECDQPFSFSVEPRINIVNRFSENIPEIFSMTTYPNPFNSTLTVNIELPRSSDLQISVYNLLGEQVALIARGHYQAGNKNFTFDASELSSGIYFIHANVQDKLNEVRKIALVR